MNLRLIKQKQVTHRQTVITNSINGNSRLYKKWLYEDIKTINKG